MIPVTPLKLLPAIAALCALLPLHAAAQEANDPLRWNKGYLLQTGFSLAAITMTNDDRLQHVAAGSAISSFVTSRTGSFWKGCAASLAAGLLKEAYDDLSGTGRFNSRDIGYTIAGCTFTVRF